jgi:predicted transcriptional regulator
MKILWKEQAYKLIDELPAEATLEDLLRELADWQALQRGLADREAGRLVPHEEAKTRIMAHFRKSA